MDKDYYSIVRHYESCLERYGDTPQGVDWPNAADAERRYEVMLGVIERDAPEPVSLLDFGCGTSRLLDHIRSRGLERRIAYSGLDISEQFVGVSRAKYPEVTYHCMDVLAGNEPLPQYDYVALNGVFTEKRGLTHAEMFDYFQRLTERVFGMATRGMAFNVMSKQVDWEREDLFHLSFDSLAAHLCARLSRRFVLRHDYRLYEYTAYVYR